ncbi:hypothetical protein [Methylopila sp. M107]|uniref:hypothetical protein n=1 Tax=Methylopila sp. M107 TaxID=1101190 RepID=UPI0003A2B441|nr:hypothetical protein [Methylopila sp. M107]
MAEIESIMTGLDANASRLKARSATMADEDSRMMAETLALMSEAVLKVGRDVRHMRSLITQRGGGLD